MNKKSITLLTAVVVLAVYFFSGICVIPPEERGVVLIFGKAGKNFLSPGINYIPPAPWGRLERVKVNEVKRVWVGKLGEWDGDEIRTQLPEEMEYLTGDINVLNIKMIVQYKITNPVRYLYTVKYVNHLIEFLTEAELYKMVGGMNVDTVLTTGKAVLQIEIQKRLQKHLDAINAGIQITSAQFRDITPPYEVAEAFNEVWASKQDKKKAVYMARGYENELEHQAGGETVRLIKAAEAEGESKIKTAEGESKKFLMLESEYRKSPSLVGKRIYLEKMEKILTRVKKVISG